MSLVVWHNDNQTQTWRAIGGPVWSADHPSLPGDFSLGSYSLSCPSPNTANVRSHDKTATKVGSAQSGRTAFFSLVGLGSESWSGNDQIGSVC